MSARQVIHSLYERLRPERITPCTPPRRVTDERDREIEFRAYRASDFESAVTMYGEFDPASRTQGVPPRGSDPIREWVRELLEGPTVVACHGDRIVGQVSFVPDGTGRHELAIFVHPAYQRAGIGSSLLAAGMGHAKQEGAEYVWLSVGKSDRGLHRFYSRAGFSVANPMGITHRMSQYL